MKSISTLVCIFGKRSNWNSVKRIQESLIAAYKSHLPDSHVVNFGPGPHRRFKKADHINRLVIISSTPHPVHWLVNIIPSFPKLSEIFFHVSGEFIYFAPEWLALLDQLKDFRIKFFSGSQFQKQVIINVLAGPCKPSVECIPYSVDPLLQKISVKERIYNRRSVFSKLAIDKNEKLFVCVGRNSFEKNVALSITALMKVKDLRWHLAILGPFDDFSPCDMNPNFKLGEFYGHFMTWVEQLPKSVQKRLHFFDYLPHESTIKFLSAADCYLNMSTFVGEDFGFSTAEALALGVQPVVTRWGLVSTVTSGFDFENVIDVYRIGLKAKVDMKKLVQTLALILNEKTLFKNHSRYQKISEKFFSESLQRKSIGKLLSAKKSGDYLIPSKTIECLADRVMRNRINSSSLFTSSNQKTALHQKLFGHALKKHGKLV